MSTTRQLDLGRAFAEAKGWTVVAAFKDEAISGKYDEVRRPGLRALYQAMDAGRLDVVVMADDSRLMRDIWNVAAALKRFHATKTRLIYYRDAREVNFDTAIGKFMEAVHGFASEAYRESSATAVREALLTRMKAGAVAGGRPAIGHAFRQDGAFKERVMRAVEAEVVTRIFRLYAAGQSIRAITRLVPQVRGRCWTKSAVARVLRSTLYIGVIRSRRKADGQVFEHVRPDLRIIDDRLWNQCQRRLREDRAIYLRRDDSGRLWSKPSNGIESKWLLTGLMQCGRCGAVLTMVVRHGYRYYCCLAHERGQTKRGWCANALALPMDLAHATILGLVEERLAPDVLRDAIVAVHRRITAARNPAQQRQRGLAELKGVEKELANLMTVVKRGTASPTIDAEILQVETRKRALTEQLERLDRLDAFAGLDVATIDAHLRAHLKTWVLRARHVAVQRQLLKKLIPTRLLFEPNVRGARKWYSFSGDLNVAPLLSGLLPAAGDQLAGDVRRRDGTGEISMRSRRPGGSKRVSVPV